MNVEARIRELGLQLPVPPKPAGNYQPWRIAGQLLFLSGQFPIENGKLRFTGQVGADLTEADGCAAAQLAALNALAQIHSALDGFDRLEALARVEGHVASAPGWLNAPRVLDGASDLLVAVLAGRGHHTRAAFTPARLPLNLAIELVFTAVIRQPQTSRH